MRDGVARGSAAIAIEDQAWALTERIEHVLRETYRDGFIAGYLACHEDEDVPRVTDAERAEALRVREVIAEDNSPR